MVFFAYGTPHCTRANNTDKDRAGLAYHFFHESQLDSAKGTTIGTTLSGPNATWGIKEYGVNLRDAWPEFVEAALRGEKATA